MGRAAIRKASQPVGAPYVGVERRGGAHLEACEVAVLVIDPVETAISARTACGAYQPVKRVIA
jgi:hypothetical protein